jgi:hypothetical protein
MVTLEQHLIRLIEAVTDGKLRSISFDLDIQVDKLKYSGWLSALSTAGIALLITNFEKVVPKIPALGALVVAVPITAALLLAASIGVGGYFHWALNKSFDRKRQEMTLFIKQKCLLYSGDATIETGDDIFDQIAIGEYLSSENQEHLKQLDKDSKKEPDEERMLLAQVILVAAGFFVAFIGAIRVPAG